MSAVEMSLAAAEILRACKARIADWGFFHFVEGIHGRAATWPLRMTPPTEARTIAWEALTRVDRHIEHATAHDRVMSAYDRAIAELEAVTAKTKRAAE